jgi:DNA-binding NtrC family response regulator
MGWRAVTVRGYVPTANMPDTARVDPHGTLREASALTDHRLLLLVEDEPDVAAFLRDLFELDGWTVEIVAHGRDALARLRECEYRVIVSDLVMPELDGAALYREVARWRPELLPRFIFISGFADTETADFIRQTRVPMISKPFRFDEIRTAITEVLGSVPPAIS